MPETWAGPVRLNVVPPTLRPRPPDLLAYALFILGWCGATSLWPGWVRVPEPPEPRPLPGCSTADSLVLGPPGAASLRRIEHLGAWRAERVADALWEGLDPTSPRALEQLVALPGIGPVSAGALITAYARLPRLLHWREPGFSGSQDPRARSHVESASLPAALSPVRPP